MKKIITLTLALILAFSLAACSFEFGGGTSGGGDPTNSKPTSGDTAQTPGDTSEPTDSPTTTKPPETTQKPTNPPATTNPPTTTKPPETTLKPTEPPSVKDSDLLGHWIYSGLHSVGFNGGNTGYPTGDYKTFYSFYEDGTFQCESRVGTWTRFKGNYKISGEKILFTNMRMMTRDLSSWNDVEKCNDVSYEFKMGLDNESGKKVLYINDLGWSRDKEPLYAFIETDDPSPGRVVQIWPW